MFNGLLITYPQDVNRVKTGAIHTIRMVPAADGSGLLVPEREVLCDDPIIASPQELRDAIKQRRDRNARRARQARQTARSDETKIRQGRSPKKPKWF